MTAGYTIRGVTPLYRGFTRLDLAEVELVMRSGERRLLKREVETHGSGAAVLPYDPARRVAVLVRQLRVPVALAGAEPYPLEAIAGLLDRDGEAPEATAIREADEEAGLVLADPEPVAAAFSSPGISTERLHLYLAEIDVHTARAHDGGGADHEDEDIEVVVVPLDELAALADAGAILDMKTFALVQTLRLRKPGLFEPRA